MTSLSVSSGLTPAASCLATSIAPIAVPIRNVSMQGPQGKITRRGAQLSVGTPPQPLAFIISDQTNNTAIFDIHNQCYTDAGANYTKPNSTAAQCFSFYGGAFNESQSSTWIASTSFQALGVPQDSITWFGPISYGTDTLSVTPNISASNFPFIVDHGRTGYEAFFMSTIGLGINSTLLNTLMAAGKIASRTWSIFNGFTGSQSQNQSDGILVFGGYDESKISGSINENVTVNMDFSTDDISNSDLAKCPATGMIINVNNMTLEWPNGTTANLMGTSEGTTMRGCVIPNYDYISITNDMWETFVSLTNTQTAGRSNSPLSWFQNLVSVESAFSGDLKISIEPGLEIIVPNHELVRPFIDIDSDGQEYISNSSVQVMGLYAMDDQTANTMPAFGRTFLTGAYLMVDADQQKFTLWKGQSSTKQKLVAHGPSSCSESAPTSSPRPSTASTLPAQAPSSVISKGAIIGICIAVILIIAFCLSIGYLLAKKSRQARASNDNDQKSGGTSLESSEASFQKPELCSDRDHQPPQEMSPGKTHDDALSPYELGGAGNFLREMAGSIRPIEMAANEKAAFEISSSDCKPTELMSTRKSTNSAKKMSLRFPTKRPSEVSSQTSIQKPLPTVPKTTETAVT